MLKGNQTLGLHIGLASAYNLEWTGRGSQICAIIGCYIVARSFLGQRRGRMFQQLHRCTKVFRVHSRTDVPVAQQGDAAQIARLRQADVRRLDVEVGIAALVHGAQAPKDARPDDLAVGLEELAAAQLHDGAQGSTSHEPEDKRSPPKSV